MKPLRILVVGILIFALVSSVGVGIGTNKQAVSGGKIPALAYHDTWLRLWEDHVTWTRLVIIGVLDGTPPGALDEYAARLFQNYHDMEDELGNFYGEQRSQAFGDLLEDHLNIAVLVLMDLKNGTDPTADLAAWYANAGQIADMMAQLNPTYWPAEMANKMWDDHLDVTADEAVSHYMKDWKADTGAYDAVVDLSIQMANFFSKGIILQFRTMFTGVDIALRPNI
jgi:hypothetical protein